MNDENKLTDSGLICLAVAAQSLGIAGAEEKIIAWNELPGGTSTDSRLFKRLAGKLGLKVKQKTLEPAQLPELPIPSVALMKDGSFAIVGRNDEQKMITMDIAHRRPVNVDTADFINQWSGQVFLLRRPLTLKELERRFNVRWFTPVLGMYKKLFGEVLIASFFLQLFGIVTPLFTQVIVDKVLPYNGEATLDVLALALLVLALFQTGLSVLRTYVLTHTTNKVDVILGTRLFRHIATLPLRYFEMRRVGDTLMRVAAMTTIRDFMTGPALTVAMDTFFSVVFLLIMYYYSPLLTWVALAAVPLFLLQNVLATPVYQRRLNAVWAAGAESNAFLVETVTGIHTVKSLAVEPQFNHRWEQILAKYVKTTFDSAVFNIIVGNSGSLVQRLSGFAILWFGGHMVIGGEMTIGQLIAFQMLAGQAGAPLLRLAGMWQQFQQAGLSAERLGDIITHPPEPVASGAPVRTGSLKGSITFEQVSFRYRPDTPPVLAGIELAIQPGMKIGVVGRSGSGKSTLTKLVQRLYLPESGRIAIDGVDVAAMDPGWLRRQIGVVLQENFLFNGTVRENIATTRPGAAMEEVIRVARIAGAHEFILELPEGYDTKVGERGMSLSGGQRQRIAIARALLNNPRILIFDEATSALDYQSERIIMRNMDKITAGRTSLIIAHRLSTVRRCDRIFVVDKGRIIEQGTHEELMLQQGLYHSLYTLQQEV